MLGDMMFSKLKKKILKKEEEESPYEIAKRDIKEHYKPISPKDTFKDLKYYVSDGFAYEGLIEKYEIGKILNEPRVILFTSKVGFPQGYLRFLILSNHMIPSSNPKYEGLGVYMNNPNSKFKVVDYFRYDGIDQIALLHLPDEGWETFSKKKYYDDIMINVRDFLLECLKMEVVPELESDEWIGRELLPVGISDDKTYFELDALNNFGHSKPKENLLSDEEEINYAYKRLKQLTDVHIRSYCISDLLNYYGLDSINERIIIEDKLRADIRNGLPLSKVNDRFKDYFKEEYRKTHPYQITNLILLDLFVNEDNDSKARLNDMRETIQKFSQLLYKKDEFNDEYVDLLSSKNLSYHDLFIFRNFAYEKIENGEINSKNFEKKIEEACDEYYEKFIYDKRNYPRTLKKAIAFLIRDLNERDIKYIKDKEKLRFSISQHFSLGLYIRNNFGIYNRENIDLLIDCDKESGYDYTLFFADSYSRVILDELWEEINKNYSSIIKSKKNPNSFYYKEIKEGKIPAPVWFRYPNSPLNDFLDEKNIDEIDTCLKNNVNVPIVLSAEIDESKPAQYVKLMKEIKIISERTLNCVPFTPKGEPKYFIELLKEQFGMACGEFSEVFFTVINDTILNCTENVSFMYANNVFLSIYQFIHFNKQYLFSEIDNALKEIKDKKKFRFFNTRVEKEYWARDEVKDVIDLDDGLLVVFEGKETQIEEQRIKDQLWNEIVQNYTEEEIWDKIKYTVALNGIYVKAMQDREFREYLLNTRDKYLINYNEFDTEWGVYADKRKLFGKNLYGLALMEVRDEIKRLYESADLIDWEYYKDDFNKDYDLSYVE